jgi:hypothetical protein
MLRFYFPIYATGGNDHEIVQRKVETAEINASRGSCRLAAECRP